MAANASLHSMASKSSIDMPVRSSSLRVAGFGADSTSTASSPATVMCVEAGPDRQPERLGRRTLGDQHRRRAVGHLRAVARGDVGRQRRVPRRRRRPATASFSSVVSRRMPSSVVSSSPVSVPVASLIGTGTISPANARRRWSRPPAGATRAANVVHRRSRVMPNFPARICATSNWVLSWPSHAAMKPRRERPVPATGVRWPSGSGSSTRRRTRSRGRSRRRSTPWAAKWIACCDEPHWRSTDVAGTVCGSPAATQALRVTLQPCSPTCVTHPPTTSSTRPGSTPVRSTSAARAWASRSVGCQPAQRALALADRRAHGVDDDGFTSGGHAAEPT